MSSEEPLVGPARLLRKGPDIVAGGSLGIDTSDERKAKLRLLAMAPYERHKLFVNTYMLTRPGDTKMFERDASKDRTPYDALQEQHRFVWKAQDSQESWEARLAKRYYDMLFREYAICDLSRYRTGVVAMRWQTQKEVESGKGQFVCGNKVCSEAKQLRTWEVPFRYEEQGEKRTELVKLRLCPDCSAMLNFKHKRRDVTKSAKKAIKRKRSGRRASVPTTDYDSSDAASGAGKKEGKDEEKKKHEVEELKKAEEAEVQAQAAAIWSGPSPVPEEEARTREDEFQAYLEDLFF